MLIYVYFALLGYLSIDSCSTRSKGGKYSVKLHINVKFIQTRWIASALRYKVIK